MRPLGIASDTRVAIETDMDIVSARQRGRAQALQIGFSPAQATLLATAISELARNILLYAGRGEVLCSVLEEGGRVGIAVVAMDVGPGIPNLERALEDGYSTSGRLGLGLPGVRRLADSFDVASSPGDGTVVTVKMWLH